MERKRNKMKYISTIACIFIASTLGGCAAKTGHSFLEEATQEDISKDLIVGQTTKTQVKRKFGDPLEIDFDAQGREKWTYAFLRADAKGVNYIPIINIFCNGTNDTIKRLTIIFDSQETLIKYAFNNSNHETKRGIFQ